MELEAILKEGVDKVKGEFICVVEVDWFWTDLIPELDKVEQRLKVGL